MNDGLSGNSGLDDNAFSSTIHEHFPKTAMRPGPALARTRPHQQMARDHRRLRVFHAAHELVTSIYRETRDCPREEWFGSRAQVRRAAVSITSNIVEGNARRGTPEYVNFLNVVRGSAAEAEYLIQLASELGYLSEEGRRSLQLQCDALIPQLEALIQKMQWLMKTEHKD